MYVPELALVRFFVKDYDAASENEFVGQYTLPFNSLKMGECFCPVAVTESWRPFLKEQKREVFPVWGSGLSV